MIRTSSTPSQATRAKDEWGDDIPDGRLPISEQRYEVPAGAPANSNLLTAGLARGWDQTAASLYAAAEVLGKLSGIDVISEWGEEGVERNIKEIMENPPKIRDWDDVDSLAAFGEYFIERMAEQVPQFVPDVLAAAAGAAAGAGVGAIPAVIGRRAAVNRLTKAAVGKALKRKLGEKAFARFATKLGASAGLTASMIAQNTGETQLTFADEGIDAPGEAALAGVVKGAFDRFSAGKMIGLVRPDSSTTLNAAKRLLTAAGVESTTESLQQAVDILAVNRHQPEESLLTEDNFKQLREAAIVGGLMGGAIRGGTDAAQLLAGGRGRQEEEDAGGPPRPLEPPTYEGEVVPQRDVTRFTPDSPLADTDNVFEEQAMEGEFLDAELDDIIEGELRALEAPTYDGQVDRPEPESQATIDAQAMALMDPTSGKDTMEVTRGSPMPTNLPPDVYRLPTVNGTAFTTNPEVAARIEATGGDQQTMGDVLYGMPDGKRGADGTTVVARDAQGVPIMEAATSQDRLSAAVAEAERQMPEGGSVEVNNVADVMAERTARLQAEIGMSMDELTAYADDNSQYLDRIRALAEDADADPEVADQAKWMEMQALELKARYGLDDRQAQALALHRLVDEQADQEMSTPVVDEDEVGKMVRDGELSEAPEETNDAPDGVYSSRYKNNAEDRAKSLSSVDPLHVYTTRYNNGQHEVVKTPRAFKSVEDAEKYIEDNKALWPELEFGLQQDGAGLRLTAERKPAALRGDTEVIVSDSRAPRKTMTVNERVRYGVERALANARVVGRMKDPGKEALKVANFRDPNGVEVSLRLMDIATMGRDINQDVADPTPRTEIERAWDGLLAGVAALQERGYTPPPGFLGADRRDARVENRRIFYNDMTVGEAREHAAERLRLVQQLGRLERSEARGEQQVKALRERLKAAPKQAQGAISDELDQTLGQLANLRRAIRARQAQLEQEVAPQRSVAGRDKIAFSPREDIDEETEPGGLRGALVKGDPKVTVEGGKVKVTPTKAVTYRRVPPRLKEDPQTQVENAVREAEKEFDDDAQSRGMRDPASDERIIYSTEKPAGKKRESTPQERATFRAKAYQEKIAAKARPTDRAARDARIKSMGPIAPGLYAEPGARTAYRLLPDGTVMRVQSGKAETVFGSIAPGKSDTNGMSFASGVSGGIYTRRKERAKAKKEHVADAEATPNKQSRVDRKPKDGVSKADALEAAKKFLRSIGLDPDALDFNIRVVTSDEVREGLAGYAGWISRDPETGDIWVTVVADNHASADAVERTIAHEVLAHYGLARFFSEATQRQILEAIMRSRGFFREAWAFVDEHYADHSEMAKAEEVLAFMAERKRDNPHPRWQKIKQMIVDALRAAGFLKGKVTQTEINGLFDAIIRGLQEGKASEAIVSFDTKMKVGDFVKAPKLGKMAQALKDLISGDLKPNVVARALFTREGQLYHISPALARVFYRRTQTQKGDTTSYWEERDRQNDYWTGRLEQLMKGQSKEDMKLAFDQLVQELPDKDLSPLAAQLRNLIENEFHSYLRSRTPVIGFIKNYFPRLYDTAEIEGRMEDFLAMAQKLEISREDAIRLAADLTSLSEASMKDSVSYMARLTKILNHRKIRDPELIRALVENGFLNPNPMQSLHSYMHSAIRRAEIEGQFGKYVSPRLYTTAEQRRAMDAVQRNWAEKANDTIMLNFLKRNGFTSLKQAIEQGWVQQDANGDLKWYDPTGKLDDIIREHTGLESSREYLTNARRRAKVALKEHFKYLTDSEGITDKVELRRRMNLKKAEMAKEFKKEYNEKFKEFLHVKRLVEGVLETLPIDRDSVLYDVMGRVRAYEGLRTLLFSGVASIPEITSVMVRAKGELTSFEFADLLKHTVTHYKELSEYAADLGVIQRNMSAAMMQEMYGAGVNGKQGKYKWLDPRNILPYMFKVNGNELQVKFTKLFSLVVAETFITRMSADVKGGGKRGERAARYLGELGLTVEQVDRWLRNDKAKDHELITEADRKAARAVQDALTRFARETVPMPNAADRVEYADHPLGGLVFHLKQFHYIFHRNLTMGVYREFQNRKGVSDNAVYAATLLPMVMFFMFFGGLSDELRNRIMSLGKRGTWEASYKRPEKMIGKWFDRSGMLTMPYRDFIFDMSLGNAVFAAGPTFSHIEMLVTDMRGDKDTLKKSLKSIPVISQVPGLRRIVYNLIDDTGE